MDKYSEKNERLWNELTPVHERSAFYDIAGFKRGKCTLKSIELEEVGDVSGKSLLHLLCHFGLDTLSWARRGATVTGVDFSEASITLARSLSGETGIKADFICSDIYALPDVLKGDFDIVFTSWGVLSWLSYLKRWAEIVAQFLKPGGIFYMVEEHPFMRVFDDSTDATELTAVYPYFHNPEPTRWEWQGSYADEDAQVLNPSYEWSHSLGDVINSLITAGLRIEYVHEFPMICWQALPSMEEKKPGWWGLKGDGIPLSFSLKAIKAA